MQNITMSLDENVLKKVRKVAINKNTTLTGLVREYLTRLAAREDQRAEEIIEELKASMDSSGVIIGRKTWTRDDLHER
jgi:DNA-directed RNA polymerase subunit F